MADAIQQKDAATALQALDQLMYQGKDPARFIEDFIYYYRDMLLYQTAPTLEDVLERVTVDEKFMQLAKEIPASEIYEIIETLSKSQQEMKWTNHPRIFLEVAFVKLCQQTTASSHFEQEGYNSLLEKITSLQSELSRLKQQGIPMSPQQSSATKEPNSGR